MVIKKEYLDEVIERLKVEIRDDLRGIEYLVGEGIYIQYYNIYKLIKVEDMEGKFFIPKDEFDYNNLNLLPEYLKSLDYFIN